MSRTLFRKSWPVAVQAAIYLVVPAAWLWGCDGAEFDSRVELSGYRVVGIESDPPRVAPDAGFTLRVHDFEDFEDPGDPGDVAATIEYAWTLCLVDPGPAVHADCPDTELEVRLDGERSATVDLGPDGVDLARRLDAAGPQFRPDGTPATLTGGFDMRVTLLSGEGCEDCQLLQSVKRIHVVADPAAMPNENPRIESFEIEGQPRAGQTITLRVETDSPEEHTDPLADEPQLESYLYTWYSALGETDPNLSFDTQRHTELEIPQDTETGTEFEVIVALRDGRGGLAVARRTVTVLP